MAWYYHLNGENKGPVELSELRNLQEQQVVTLDTPVWTEGMETWARYGDSTAAGPSGPPISTVKSVLTPVAPTHTCVECHKSFPEAELLNYENSWVCPACKPVFFQRVKEGVATVGTMNYASVVARFVAIFIDSILMQFILTLPIFLIFGMDGIFKKDISGGANAGITLAQWIVPAAYEIVLIALYGATLGKMAMGIKVVTPEGGPVSFGRSTGRYFAKILSALILCIGYFMAFWDPEKRALHDRLCGTRVISVR